MRSDSSSSRSPSANVALDAVDLRSAPVPAAHRPTRPSRSSRITPSSWPVLRRDPRKVSSRRVRSSLWRRAIAPSISRAARATRAVLCGRKMSIRPDRSTTPTTRLSKGSRIGTPAQLQGLMPAQKCSAACTNTGSPVHSAVPMPLVPTTCSFQTPPTSRWIRRPSSSVWRSPMVSTITPSWSVRISMACAPSSSRPTRAKESRAASRKFAAVVSQLFELGLVAARVGASPRVASIELRAQRCQNCWIRGRTWASGRASSSPSTTKLSHARMIACSS